MESYGERAGHHLSCVLVLDEPTGNMDPRHRKEFIKFFNDLNIAKIIATHDIEMVKSSCDKAAIIDEGSLAAFGNKDEIFGNTELLSRYGLV